MVRLLELYRDRGSLPLCVIHCFTGNKEQARKYLSMGCYIGLTGGRRGSFIRSLEKDFNFICMLPIIPSLIIQLQYL